MDPVVSRIDAWQQAGLIDPATADRLRADQAAQPPSAGSTGSGASSASAPSPAHVPGRRGVSASDILGPSPIVAEMFLYLGGGFLLAAWTAFVQRLRGDEGSFVILGGGLLVAAVVLGAIGLVLRSGDDRRRRGAGVVLLGATLYALGSAAGFLGGLNVSGSAEVLVLAVLAIIVAAAVRFLHAGLLTQFGLLVAITSLGGAILGFLNDLVRPTSFTEKGFPIGATPDPLLMILASGATWLVIALAIGLLALRESDARRDSAAAPGAPSRRAALTRAWAGTVAVIGLTSALARNDVLVSGDYGRIVTPWIMDAILLALAAALVERAFRRNSGAFLLAAGIALIAALTDFNFSYLSSSTELGLLVEGALLLAVGFGADRLRRRLRRGPDGDPGDAAVAVEPDPSATTAAI